MFGIAFKTHRSVYLPLSCPASALDAEASVELLHPQLCCLPLGLLPAVTNVSVALTLHVTCLLAYVGCTAKMRADCNAKWPLAL